MNKTDKPESRFWSALAILLFIAVMLADGVYCWKRASGLTDTLAYASLTSTDTGNTFLAEDLDCLRLLKGPERGCVDPSAPYAVITAKYSPQEYRSFLRFYGVKPAYVFLLRLLHRGLHLSIYSALRTVTVASFLLLGTVIRFWFREHFAPMVATLLTLTLINTQFVIYLGKQLLPDGMSTALLLLAVYLLIYRKNKWPGAVLLALLPIVRPDNIVFVGFFGAAVLWRMERPRRERFRYLALLVMGCGVLHLTLRWATHPLPWAALFYHTTANDWAAPSTYETAHISIRMYLHVLAFFGGRTLLLHLPVIAFFGTLVLIGRSTQSQRDLVWVSAAAAAVRFLLFPSMEERFYTWFLLMCVLMATGVLGDMLRETSPAMEVVGEDESVLEGAIAA